MYCFRCGKKLPGREIYCPDCDTPRKKRQRRNRRMVLGLFIFLSGAFAGSLIDSYLFKGQAWKHSLLNDFFGSFTNNNTEEKIQTSNRELPIVQIDRGNDPKTISLYSEKNDMPDGSGNIENTQTAATDIESLVAEPLATSDASNNQSIKSGFAETINSVKAIPVDEALPTVDSIIANSKTSAEASQMSTDAVENSTTDNNSSESLPKYDEPLPKYDEPLPKYDENTPLPDAPVDTEKVDSIEVASAKENAPVEDAKENISKPLAYKGVAVVESAGGNSYHGFVSRDCKEMVFASDRNAVNGKPTYQCFIKSLGNNSQAKRAFEWNGNIWTPELTPDSNMIVFSSDSAKPEHLFVYDRKSGNSMPLTSGNSKNMMPSISPDGKSVAFVSNRGGGKSHIWVVDLFNSSKLLQITKGNYNDREPRWSSDGKSIVFTRIIENMKLSHIMKVNIDTLGEPETIVSDASRNWLADYSPDGTLLAYTRSMSTNGSRNVIILRDVSSGHEEELKFPGINDSYRPVWLADGSGFVFHVNKKAGKQLYKANFSRE